MFANFANLGIPYQDLSPKFMRFAVQFLTNGKHDPQLLTPVYSGSLVLITPRIDNKLESSSSGVDIDLLSSIC